MKRLIIYLTLLFPLCVSAQQNNHAWKKAIDDPAAAKLARPSAAQFNYQELERTMFVCLSLNTWTGEEYDLGGIPVSVFNPTKLDTDQWCLAAKNMGAKSILFVAKHVGGFCLWQTESTDYSLKSAPWKNGKGDVLKELSLSCKKHGLGLGIYIYPGDMRWGAGIGSGGKTDDPNKQEAYNKVLRQQWTECLTKYGDINELWFDGSCIVDLKDIIEKHAPNAVVLQGPLANIRWPGDESGTVPYPAWNSLMKEDLATGVATAVHGNPDGDAWAPLEADTVLYDHAWFWSKNNETKRRSLQELIKIYYHSVGRGAVLLLNSTPNTDGLIPDDDMVRYKEFGDEINRRFDKPLADTSGTGKTHTMEFDNPTKINQVMLMEDYRHGERIREFVLEGKTSDGIWRALNYGSAVGRKRIIVFKEQALTAIRLKITKNVGIPLLRSFKVYYVENIGYDFLVEDSPAISTRKPATASHIFSAQYSAEKINDGDLDTRWGSTENGTPCWVELDLENNFYINQVSLRELADRVREYQIEFRSSKDEEWKVAYHGKEIGNFSNPTFPTAYGRYFRLNILKATTGPTLWQFQLHEDTNPHFTFHTLTQEDLTKDGHADLHLDISQYFTKPGQYKIEILPKDGSKTEVLHFEPIYDGNSILKEMYSSLKQDRLYQINRTAQIVESTKVEIKLHLKGKQLPGTKLVIYPPSY